MDEVELAAAAGALLVRWREQAERCRAGEPDWESGPRDAGEALFHVLLAHAYDGVILSERSSRWILEVSEAFCTLTGFRRDELLGRTSVELGLVPQDTLRAHITAQVDAGAVGLYEGELTRKDGEKRWVEFSHALLGGDFVMTVVRDVTARRAMQKELQRLADTDPLTGLLNPRRFREEIARALREAKRFGDDVTLMVVDVDRFKAVNDMFGHPVGDEALRAVGEALGGITRETDFVARVGGDEFAVLFTRPVHGGVRRATAELRRVLAAQHGPLAGLEVSVGVASASVGADDVDSFLSRADAAMYDDKTRIVRR